MKFLEANLPPELSTRSQMVYKQMGLSIFIHAHVRNRETLPLR